MESLNSWLNIIRYIALDVKELPRAQGTNASNIQQNTLSSNDELSSLIRVKNAKESSCALWISNSMCFGEDHYNPHGPLVIFHPTKCTDVFVSGADLILNKITYNICLEGGTVGGYPHVPMRLAGKSFTLIKANASNGSFCLDAYKCFNVWSSKTSLMFCGDIL